VGRRGAITPDQVSGLVEAQAQGLAHLDTIAYEYAPHDADRRTRAARYLRDNVRYGLGDAERRGLQLFLDYAADLGLGPGRRDVAFF
jgi:predicted solute-binding protein